MKAKIVRGNGFGGCLGYIVNKKGAECIGGTVLGDDPHTMAREFRSTELKNRSIQKPVWHCSLTLPKGERLNNEQWEKVTSQFFKEMEISKNRAYTVVRHSDTELDHVHMVVHRLALDGQLWHGRQDVYRAIDVTQKLEKEYGLTQTKGYEKPAAKKNATRAEMEQALRTQQVSAKQRCQSAVDTVLQDGQQLNFDKFCEQLAVLGVGCRLARSGERVRGVSFNSGEISVKGSALGKSYSWQSLQDRGVKYERRAENEANATVSPEGRESTTRKNEPAGAETQQTNADKVSERSRKDTRRKRRRVRRDFRANSSDYSGQTASSFGDGEASKTASQSHAHDGQERNRSRKEHKGNNRPSRKGQATAQVHPKTQINHALRGIRSAQHLHSSGSSRGNPTTSDFIKALDKQQQQALAEQERLEEEELQKEKLNLQKKLRASKTKEDSNLYGKRKPDEFER